MAARKKDQTDNHRGSRLSGHRLDGISYNGHQNNGTEDLGSLQYIRYIKGIPMKGLKGSSANLAAVVQRTANQKEIQGLVSKIPSG